MKGPIYIFWGCSTPQTPLPSMPCTSGQKCVFAYEDFQTFLPLKPQTVRSCKLTWENLAIQAQYHEYLYEWKTLEVVSGGGSRSKKGLSYTNILEDIALRCLTSLSGKHLGGEGGGSQHDQKISDLSNVMHNS